MEFLIDSGSPVNTIPSETWAGIQEECHAGKMKIFNLVAGGSRELYGYGSDEPLEVLCSFRACLKVRDAVKPTRVEEFFVVSKAKHALMGDSTAKAMKLLKVGIAVNNLVAAGLKMDETKDGRFPTIPNLKLKFDIDDSVAPRKDFRYDIPAGLEESLNNELEELERQGIIEPAPTTPKWVSRLKAVAKGNGEIRWVVTMLGPNKAIRRVYYPMPTMDKLAAKMSGARFFTKLDIKKAFLHVELEDESRDMTTFMTSKGPMRFTRLAFGVTCAPEAFQKIMEDLLRGCKGVAVFIDDILVYSETREQLQERTEVVKGILAANNLTLNQEKCEYESTKVDFLGFTIDETGMRPTADKVQDVIDCERPETVTQVRSLLGMITFMGSFIERLSELTEPLRRLTEKNQPFEWGEEQENAFQKIKDVVANHVKTRGFFNGDDETWLCTDASPVGLGAVLVQEGWDPAMQKKTKRIIAFASKALTKTEATYPQTQREALAVVWAVEKFHFYLIGRDFHLVVDHQPLAFIFHGESRNNKRATTRAESYAQRLGTYRFNVEVVKGEENIADYLSRKSLTNKIPYDDSNGPHELGALSIQVNPLIRAGLQAVTVEEMRKVSEKDEVFEQVREAMATNEWKRPLARYGAFKEELRVRDGLLLRGHRIVAPAAIRSRLMRAAHLGHPGMVSMKRTLRHSVWWPSMDADVEGHVKACMGCTIVTRADPPEPMVRTNLPEEPWDYLAIDFNSPTSLGVKLLVVVDYFSRMVFVRVMKETDADHTIDQLEDLFVTFGYPKFLKLDNGPPFKSRKFREWADSKGITLVFSTPLAPWMNGEAESQMRGIDKILRIAVAQKEPWQVELNKYLFAYNRRVHPVTGLKPAEMMFKRKVRDLLPTVEDPERNEPVIEEARDKDKVEKHLGKLTGDARRRAKKSSLEIGDVVLMETKPTSGLQSKFGTTPFTIIEKRGGTVTIRNEEGTTYRRSTCQVKKMPVERAHLGEPASEPSEDGEPASEPSENGGGSENENETPGKGTYH